jgi:hypothetical protein
LDPACGSGTFLVEALARLRKHLESKKPCHEKEKGQPEWVVLKKRLETILNNINGIDINPFAAFLTTINLTFQVIDMYAAVKHKYPEFSLAFNIATHDSLADKPVIQKIDPKVNSRVKEAWIRSKKYADLCEREFSIVIGNPPWGAVLRGSIGPLGDEAQREIYKEKFHSATGKYDFYVLFIERGLSWLRSDGILSMITQVTYVSQDFGKGIQKVIEEESGIKLFIDISDFGATIFPKRTNYPAITVLKRGIGKRDLELVEVKRIE